MDTKILLRKLKSAIQLVRYPRFAGIKLKASGMLSPEVYAAIYDVARRAPDLDVLEIGAARGAATVVLASAMIDSGKHAKVIAVEKFAGGSNVEFGSKDENLAKIRSLFDDYGVSDRVVLFAEYLTEANAEELQALISTEQVGLLMVDADGRLDVHLPLIWSRLAPHCSIVLDDYRERHEFAVRSEKHPQGRTKELLCFRLVNKLQELGYIEIERVLGNTVFARKARSDAFGADDRAALRDEVSSVEREYAAWLAQASSGPSSG